ncbi:MAG TPA: UvrD-helicase domain-containing protein [Pirellulales bacterium]|nr:UvrD-helicase domain-containing protein [Pirellulales bacterium]
MSKTKIATERRTTAAESGSGDSVTAERADESPDPENRFPHIVIRASAGTGKTFQLSNRFLGLAAAGQSPDHILATTFARKAAGEILDRVLLRLAEAADDPKKLSDLKSHLHLPWLDAARCIGLLRGLIDRLHRLQISTLDSFFIRIATSFGLELGLPPGWRIVEAIEDKQLRYEAIQQVLHDHPLSDTSQLVRLLGKGDATRSITDEIADIVSDLYEDYRETGGSLDVWQKLPHAQELDDDSLREALAALEALPQLDGKLLNKTRASDFETASARDWAGFISVGLARPLLAGSETYRKQTIPPEFAAAYRPLLDHARAVLLNQLANQTQGTGRLLAHFDDAYRPLKLSRRAMRFDDVTHYLGAALAAGRLNDVGYRLDSGVSHLLLDEFQDTSLAQWAVLRPFARRVTSGEPKRSLFCVGDVKQAIYGWRGGIAELLNALGSELSGLVDDSLTESHRSAPVVIDLVNRVFRGLATNGALCEYREAAKCWGEQFGEHTTARIALPGQCRLRTAPKAGNNWRSREQQRATLEDAAAIVATAAAENPGRSIGVLVRRNKAVARLIYELRERHHLFASQEGGNPLTDSPAVQLILSLLALADHPGDTVARFHVAYSPLGKAIGFADHADDRAAQHLAADLRARLLADGYGPTIYGWVKSLALECGRRDVSRMLQLVEMGYAFDDGKIRRPDEFLAQARERSVEDPLSAPIRVMTVHQSKGLQFDIVVLPQLDEPLVGQPPKLVVGRDSPTGPIERVCRYASEDVQKLLPPEFQRMFECHTERLVSESLCLLYVAMTRAVYSLEMIVAPQHGEKPKGGGAAAWPKTFAGILLSALAAGDDAPPESEIFRSGDPDWSGRAPAAEAVSLEAMPASAAAELETVGVELRPSSKKRRRGLDRRSPSKLEGGMKVDLAQRLQLESAAGMARGTLVHGWLESIEWLENGRPDRATLLHAAAPLADPRIDVAAELDRFDELLARPAVEAALSRSSYSQPGNFGLPRYIHDEIAAGLKAGTVRMELHREWPFAVRLDDAIVQGFVDRLLLYLRADTVGGGAENRSSPLAVDILDFKTDAVESSAMIASRAEFYRPQLAAYRRAVAEVFRLDPRRITARLLFVVPGVSVSVES